MMRQASIAIIGSGLAGALLADELSNTHSVTVFERGATSPLAPRRPRATRRPLGLFPSFGYGLGGTTNYWHGGLIAMSAGEFEGRWPAAIPAEIGLYEAKVVERLYGAEMARWWASRPKRPADADVFVDVLVKPFPPFRASRSACFSRSLIKLAHHVQTVIEAGDGVVVTATTAEGPRDYGFDLAILAAGGVNSPLILRRGGLGGAAVGRNLTDHPMGFVAKISKAGGHDRFAALTRHTDGDYPLEPMLKVRDKATGLWTAFYLRPTSTPSITSDPYAESFDALSARGLVQRGMAGLRHVADADFRAQAYAQLFGRAISGAHAYVLAVSEQEAMGQGRVDEAPNGDVSMDWTVSTDVTRSIQRSTEVLADWAGGVITWPSGDLKDRLWSAAHHSGGCRIAEDPDHGVVDTDLRVHGAGAIYVCDGSVLSSSGASNTGLTIGALSLRLAAHLARRTRSVVAAPPRDAAPTVLVSGPRSQVAKMVLSEMTRSGLGWEGVSLRGAVPTPPRTPVRCFLHLANEASSVAENLLLQEKAATLLTAAGLTEIVVPMSFATLQVPGPKAADTGQFNFGFALKFRNVYIDGKLAVERFWIDWQAKSPNRRVTFIYVPTILGPNSLWSQMIASHRPGSRVWVLGLKHFFAIDEGALARRLVSLLDQGLPEGVSRILFHGQCEPLKAAIVSDRAAADVHELNVPAPLWRVLDLSDLAAINRAAGKILKVADKILDRATANGILPIEPLYYGIFRLQSRFASTFRNADR